MKNAWKKLLEDSLARPPTEPTFVPGSQAIYHQLSSLINNFSSSSQQQNYYNPKKSVKCAYEETPKEVEEGMLLLLPNVIFLSK